MASMSDNTDPSSAISRQSPDTTSTSKKRRRPTEENDGDKRVTEVKQSDDLEPDDEELSRAVDKLEWDYLKLNLAVRLLEAENERLANRLQELDKLVKELETHWSDTWTSY